MIVTYTGRYFDYNNITKDSIYIGDILPSITRLNRYMGHTSRPYGVGEHTLMCYFMAEKLGYSTREKLLVLVHDFTEAYCGDVNTDLKNLIPEYRKIEKEVELAIYDYLEIDKPTEEEEEKVKRIDLTMLVIEMRDITLHDYRKKIEEVGEDSLELRMLDDLFFDLNDVFVSDEKYAIELLSNIYNYLMEEIKKGD